MDFVAATSYDGPRPGFIFKAGPQGTGYYRDEDMLASKKLATSGIKAFSSNPVYDPVKWTAKDPAPVNDQVMTLDGMPVYLDPADLQRMRRQQHQPQPSEQLQLLL